MRDIRLVFPSMVVGGTISAVIGELLSGSAITEVSLYCILIGIIGSMFSGVIK